MVVGVNEHGQKRLLTLEDRVREPAQSWRELLLELNMQIIQTTNQIKSTFSMIKHRTKRTKGCLNRNGMLCMMFKLGQCADNRWRGFQQLGEVIEEVQFKDGVEESMLNDQVPHQEPLLAISPWNHLLFSKLRVRNE